MSMWQWESTKTAPDRAGSRAPILTSPAIYAPLPNPLLQVPAENVTPSLFRQHIKAATQAPVMQNCHLGRVKAVLRLAHVEDSSGRCRRPSA
jgi:hypothetical protein